MKKTGLVLAAAAASLFVVGCATQADNSAQPAPVAAQPMAADVMPHYKGGNSCKKMMKKHHRHHAAAKKAAAADANSTPAAGATGSSSADASSSNAQ